jgi:hypothetical protein
VLYFSGELDNIEYVGQEYGLGLVTQETEQLLIDDSSAFTSVAAAPYSKLIEVSESRRMHAGAMALGMPAQLANVSP